MEPDDIVDGVNSEKLGQCRCYFLARRAILVMLKDRGFRIPQSEINPSFEDFRSLYGLKPNLEKLQISTSLSSDPNEKLLVVFCGSAVIGLTEIWGILNQIVDRETLQMLILVVESKMTSQASRSLHVQPFRVEVFQLDLLVNMATEKQDLLKCGEKPGINCFSMLEDSEGSADLPDQEGAVPELAQEVEGDADTLGDDVPTGQISMRPSCSNGGVLVEPKVASRTLEKPKLLPLVPAVLAASLEEESTSFDQLMVLTMHTCQAASKKERERAGRITALEQEVRELKDRLGEFENGYDIMCKEAALFSQQVHVLEQSEEELQGRLDSMHKEMKKLEAAHVLELEEAREQAVAEYAYSSRGANRIDHFANYNTSVILQMVNAQLEAMGVTDFTFNSKDRLGFEIAPPPYIPPPVGTFADDGEKPLEAWPVVFPRRGKDVAPGMETELLETMPASSSGTKRKVAPMAGSKNGTLSKKSATGDASSSPI